MLEYVDSTPSLLACSSQHFFSVASSSANHVVKSWCKEGNSSALVVQNLVQLKFSIKNSTVQLCLGKNTAVDFFFTEATVGIDHSRGVAEALSASCYL